MRHIILGLACTCSAALVTAPLAPAQEGSPLGFVNKLGQDLDVRSGGRVLDDEILSGKVILPELATPIAGVPAIPQIQLRGGNHQVNDPGLDYVQIFASVRSSGLLRVRFPPPRSGGILWSRTTTQPAFT